MQLLTSTEGWLVLLAFGLLFVGVTWLNSRKADLLSKTGFLLANRRVGWVKAGFSVAATWIWAPALFVAAQQGYQHGWVGVFWFTVPNVACLIFFGFFAAKARDMFPEGFTISSAAGARYSTRVQKVYLVALIGLAVSSFAVQILAGSAVISVLTGISFFWISVVLSIIALSYTAYAGLRGSVITDFLQMWVIATVGFALALAVAVVAGWDTLGNGVRGVDQNYTSLFSGPGASLFWSFGLSTTIGLISGPFGDQSFWQRAWAVERKDVRKSFILGAGVFAIVPLVMSLLGFAAAGGRLEVISPQLTNLSAVLEWLPTWTVLPFLLYVFSGLVSTMSSQLSAVSTFAGHDMARGEQDARRLRNFARISMVVLAIGAVAIANIPGIAIVQLFIFYGTLRACTLMPTIHMLTHRGPVSERGAFWGIVVALVVGVPMSAYGNLNDVVPMIWGSSVMVITVTALGAFGGTWLESRPGGVLHPDSRRDTADADGRQKTNERVDL